MPSNTLPIIENWDCHQCGVCCQGTTIPLNEVDLKKINEQNWENVPEFKNVKTTVRSVLMGGQTILAKKANGECIFLGDDKLCMIHKKFGEAAKPAICRMFPFHFVRRENGTRLTVRRSCPSAAEDKGRPLSDQVGNLERGKLSKDFVGQPISHPPAVAVGARRSWPEFEAAADAIARIVSDENFPMVRRMIHAVKFSELLAVCKLDQVNEDAMNELIEMLEQSSIEGAGEWFSDRQPPSKSSQSLLRQAALHYLRSHPESDQKDSMGHRLRSTWQSLKFVRGKSNVPNIGLNLPTTAFADVDRKLGPLPADVSEPLNRLLETHTQSRFFAFTNRHRTLVDSFRCLAFTYPIALWMLRLLSTGREPNRDDMVNVVVSIERGQGLTTFTTLAKTVAESSQLQRLIAWYAR